MKTEKVAIFDLDGTLINTSVGISNCVKYAETKLSLKSLNEAQYLEFIGPPPHETYQRLHGLSPEKAFQALEFHREYAISKGIFEAELYTGIPELLQNLVQKNYALGVATYKRQDLAEPILEHFKISQYFDSICGLDSGGKLSKSDIIEICIERLNATKTSKLLYIGDSEYDAIAAQNLNLNFIGVTWGFGFTCFDDINKFPNIGCADSVAMLLDICKRDED